MLAKVYPPPISLLSKISLIKDYNSYFSHTARIGREYRLCAFFTLHRLRKPQGTQGVELRSTSQRNNRNVVGIETRQSKLGEVQPAELRG